MGTHDKGEETSGTETGTVLENTKLFAWLRNRNLKTGTWNRLSALAKLGRITLMISQERFNSLLST